MKKSLLSLGLAAVLGLASASASASTINVGGVVWDPESTNSLPSLVDFTSSGSLLETVVDPTNGITHVTGWGSISSINNVLPNATSFCPSCELTFTFSMDLDTLTPTGLTSADFSFKNLAVSVWVDAAKNFIGTAATAADGTLWLSMVGNGNLNGTGENIGSGSDTGSGNALLDVTGGLAQGNFDTNTRLNGADFVFSSSFQPLVPGQNTGLLKGDLQLTGNSIPEPGSMALLGLGLAGLGLAQRRRKAAK